MSNEECRLQLLNEIYKEENENLKKEYRILFDEFMLEKQKDEKKQYWYSNLLKRPKCFEKKNKCNTDNEKCIEAQENKVEIYIEKDNLQESVINKVKIALVVDVREWALDNIAKNIVKHLGNKYEFKIIYMEDIPDYNIVHLLYACKDYDIIHFIWRGYISFMEGDFAKQYLSYYGRGAETFYKEILKNSTITFSVYDHNFVEDEREITNNIFKHSKYYTVSSKKLYEIYSNLDVEKPIMEITDGIDLQKFTPNNLERFDDIDNRKIIVGWVGNSNWSGKKDHKGINTIIKPAVEELKEEGYNIDLEIIDKNKNFVKHDDMPNYYNSIDLYICASLNEGTPNPVLEAMACGIPIISTDVGIVMEAFGKEQKEYILEERSIECLKEKIKKLIINKDKMKELSKENLEQIKEWTWEKKCKQFEEFFEYVLQSEKE